MNYGRSEAMIPSAPREMTMEELPDIVRMEEMFCQKAPEARLGTIKCCDKNSCFQKSKRSFVKYCGNF